MVRNRNRESKSNMEMGKEIRAQKINAWREKKRKSRDILLQRSTKEEGKTD